MHDTAGRLNQIKKSFLFIEENMTADQKNKEGEFYFKVKFGQQKVRELEEVLDKFYLENPPIK